MKNGFCMPKPGGKMTELCHKIKTDAIFADDLIGQVRVGIHWDTEVRHEGISSNVCQVCCSTVPVSFTHILTASDWAPFATAMLCSAYDATLCVAALLAAERGTRVRVFLTAVGGGALGNRPAWIIQALDRVLAAYASEPLDVYLVHFASTSRFDKLQVGRPRVPPKQRITLDERIAALAREVGETHILHHTGKRASSRGDVDPQCLAIAKAFAYFDGNGDGVINRSELSYILKSLDSALFNDQTIGLLLRQADADGDGLIQYLEFVTWVLQSDSIYVSRVLSTASFLTPPSVVLHPDEPVSVKRISLESSRA